MGESRTVSDVQTMSDAVLANAGKECMLFTKIGQQVEGILVGATPTLLILQSDGKHRKTNAAIKLTHFITLADVVAIVVPDMPAEKPQLVLAH